MTFGDGAPLTLHISDQFLSNVFRKLAEIEFEKPVESITVCKPLQAGGSIAQGTKSYTS